MFERIGACRSCGALDLELVLEFGDMPLADGLCHERDLAKPEPTYPLSVVVCGRCGLMQLRETVDPKALYCREYPYFSSFIPALLRHSEANVVEQIETRRLGRESLVVEIASNDGYLLQYYADRGIPVLGIDPAAGPAEAARSKGIETLATFFDLELARRLRAEGRRADVIHANNVLAHVPDPNGFVAGIATLLADDGVAVIECPHVLELIRHCEFDTIYHEHLCYFSVSALKPLFARNGLVLHDVQPMAIHGGSIRLFASREGQESAGMRALLGQEQAAGLDRPEGFRAFGSRVLALREALRALLTGLRQDGARIAAYGAAAKGATLLNYTGLGHPLLEFVVDRNTHKQGRYMPGQQLRIEPPECLLERKPDYTLLLAWNFKEEILAQQAEYRSQGGRFIVPVPEPVIV